ncbi:MAG: hypothetical protein U9N42_05280 [Campylobacterota bacterium]|nr:hypothetical protein [Campylobacterota bacterium]
MDKLIADARKITAEKLDCGEWEIKFYDAKGANYSRFRGGLDEVVRVTAMSKKLLEEVKK